MSLKKVNLSIQVLVALFAGMLLGILLNSFPSEWSQNYLIGGLFHVLGQMFFSALQLLVVPVVFFSLTCGVASIGSSVAAVGRIGIKTFVLYTLTTMLAITLAIIGAVIV